MFFESAISLKSAQRRNSLNMKKTKSETQQNSDSVPSHAEIRISMLTLLYKKAEKSPRDSSVGSAEFIKALNVQQNIIDFNWKYLEQEKLIETVSLFERGRMTGATITASGINVIEHKEENKKRFPFLNATIPIQIQIKIGIINL